MAVPAFKLSKPGQVLFHYVLNDTFPGSSTMWGSDFIILVIIWSQSYITEKFDFFLWFNACIVADAELSEAKIPFWSVHSFVI